MAISVDLGQQLEIYVARLIESGRYNSKSEVLREGVRLVQEREAKLAALDDDLDAIADWIAEDNPSRALSFVQELMLDCRRLLDHPLAHPLLSRFEGKGVRRKTRGDYLIFLQDR